MSYQFNKGEFAEACYEAESLFDEQSEKTKNSITPRVYAPSRFGHGHISIRQLSNMTLMSSNMCFNRNLSISEETNQESFVMMIVTGSDLRFEQKAKNFGYTYSSGTVTLGYSQPKETYTWLIPQGKHIQTLSVYFSKEQLEQYIVEFDRTDLIKKINNANPKELLSSAVLSTRHLHLISRLTNNPYKGLLEKLYFDAIANELLLCLLESLCKKDTTEISLNHRDRELLIAAKELLLTDLQNPPSITELARAVGINEDKLKKGFKILFNNTVFKTLTEHRMKIAMEKLRHNNMSVAEVAYDAGYINVSNFIVAFRKIYGMTPGSVGNGV